MNFFKKHKTLIFRIVGVLLILSSISAHYLAVPRQMSENEKAEQRIARVEAKTSATRLLTTKSDTNPYRSSYEEYKEKQIEYFKFIFILLGVGLLISSFMSKEK